jgi:hypothetical protein
MALWIKGCPRCRGDLYSDRDIMGYYRQCMQCGYTFYEKLRRLSRPLPSGEVEGPASPESPRSHEVADAVSEVA